MVKLAYAPAEYLWRSEEFVKITSGDGNQTGQRKSYYGGMDPVQGEADREKSAILLPMSGEGPPHRRMHRQPKSSAILRLLVRKAPCPGMWNEGIFFVLSTVFARRRRENFRVPVSRPYAGSNGCHGSGAVRLTVWLPEWPVD